VRRCNEDKYKSAFEGAVCLRLYGAGSPASDLEGEGSDGDGEDDIVSVGVDDALFESSLVREWQSTSPLGLSGLRGELEVVGRRRWQG
jgi:hypothetical protein